MDNLDILDEGCCQADFKCNDTEDCWYCSYFKHCMDCSNKNWKQYIMKNPINVVFEGVQ